MSYDYKIFRIDGQAPSSIEELLESTQPFDSFESSKLLLSRNYPEIVWNDEACRGTLENDIGRFEFQCDAELLAVGVISLSTSFRQDVFATRQFLLALCQAEGFAVVDEQTQEIIGAA